MKENFLEKILDNPRSLGSFPAKNIDPLTHNFDSESISDRLYSLYSVLITDFSVSNNRIKNILLKYQPELNFIKAINRITNDELARVEYSKLISNNRDNILEKLFN
jgi:hypothetical protein